MMQPQGRYSVSGLAPRASGLACRTLFSMSQAPTPAPQPPVCDLSVRFCGIEFKNPIIAASGTFGYGVEFEDIVPLEKLGGFVVKGLSREPMAGNPPPRVFETAAGML